MKGIIKLEELKMNIERLDEVSYCEISAHPNKLTIDALILKGNYDVYLPKIAKNINLSVEDLAETIEIQKKGFKDGLYRISIPMKRLQKGCYCSSNINIETEDVLSGDLIINDSFGQFPINIDESHMELAMGFYDKLQIALSECVMSARDYASKCPYVNNSEAEYKSYCTHCIRSRKLQERMAV